MANSLTHLGTPPVRAACYTVLVPFMDATGALLDPTACDTEVSKDGGAFADATNEITVLSNGIGYITFTATEMTCGVLVAVFKSTNAKPTPMVIYPRTVVSVWSDATAQAGSNNTITLASTASSVNQYYNGMIIILQSGTGVADASAKQARVILAYNGSTKVATVGPTNWENNPASDTTYKICATAERPHISMEAIADQVWDELVADHSVAGSIGNWLYRLFCRVIGKKFFTDSGDGTIISTAEDGVTPVDTWTKSTNGDQTIYTRS